MAKEQERGQEQTKFWLAHDLGNFEVLRATYFRHSFSRHTHEGFAIGVIERGGEAFYYRGAMHVAPAGSIIVINPGEIHTGHAASEAGWSYRMLYPDASLLQQVATDVTGRQRNIPFFPAPIFHDASLAALIHRLHLTLEAPTSSLERESGLVQTFAQLITRYADDRPQLRMAGKERHPVQRVRAYLEEHYAENVSLEQLAGIANLSPFHLLRVFHAETGLSPHLFLTHIRIARAKALLLRGRPIAQIALETGFVDQSHFTRQFKRQVGITPGQYAPGSKNVQDRLI
jgi:AraC-like DNA-binding protein